MSRRVLLVPFLFVNFSSRHQCTALQTRGSPISPIITSCDYAKSQLRHSSYRRASPSSSTALGRDTAPNTPVLQAAKGIRSPTPSRPTSKNTASKHSKPTDPFQGSIGVFLAFGVIIALAISRPQDLTSQVLETDVFDTVARDTATNILGAAAPTSSTDLVAAALGESIGGILGATCGALVTMIGGQKGGKANPLVVEAIADSDFFIANSASMPLLRAAGVPPAIASIVGVVVASIPSQLVKASSQENERKVEEKLLMEKLLAEEKLKKEARNPFFKPFLKSGTPKSSDTADQKDLEVVKSSKLDLVEVFSDCTRWLAYDVLKTDFGETLMWNGLLLDKSLTGAVFGLVAAISSQLYADLFYGIFKYGPEERQKKLSSRSQLDWLAVYASRGVSTAALFGVYEFSQGPIARYIQGTLAGGVDGCVGSKAFEACMQTYIDTNAPGPSAEAQFRALVINLSIVYQRLQDIAGDTSLDDFKTLAHEWLVSISG